MSSQELKDCFKKVVSSYTGALSSYQIWFTLRGEGKALDTNFEDMNDHSYVDFFHATNFGNYKLMFIETASLFDSDNRAASISSLKFLLNSENLPRYSNLIEVELKKYRKLVTNIKTIRSRIIAHKEMAVSPSSLHEKHGIKPIEIKELLQSCGKVLREVEIYLTSNTTSSTVCTTNRFEKATFSLLDTLSKGRNS